MRIPLHLSLALSLLGTAHGAAAGAGSEPHAGRPNIIVIITDDQGWADLAVQSGRAEVRTPHLDALAADGIRFTRGYVAAPVCVPSRAGLLTGRYQTRFGMETNADGPLPATELTIGDRMRQAGYATALVGKWHVASSAANLRNQKILAANQILWGDNASVDDPNLPGRRGFDEYFCGAMRNYAASFDLQGNAIPDAPRLINDNRFRVDVTTEAALAYLSRTGDQPFFLYVGYFAPHVPLEAPPKYMERFADVEDPLRRTGLAMISAIDDGVGQIRQRLSEMGVADNTLIFYLSDNGAPTKPDMWDGSINEPLLGEKGMVADGGLRVPFIATWPGRLPARRIYDKPVISLDILPTALGAAGHPVDPDWALDGVNLLPFLTGEDGRSPHDHLFWRFSSQAAVMNERWKLVFFAPDKWMLFDLTSVAGERLDVADRHPEVVRDLTRRLQQWCGEQTPAGLPKARAGEDNYFFNHYYGGGH